jgi:hypothetical protein
MKGKRRRRWRSAGAVQKGVAGIREPGGYGLRREAKRHAALAPADYELPRANLRHLEECLKQERGSDR